MILDTPLLFAYFLTIVLFLGTPGPVTVLVVNASVKSGFRAGLATVAGTNIASLILITLSFIVIQGVFSISEGALVWLSFLGAFYLIYFAIGIIKDKVDMQQVTVAEPDNANLTTGPSVKQLSLTKTYFRDGFLIGISNPKDILFFIAFFPLFLKITPSLTSSMIILTLVWIVLDYSILSFYSFIFAKVKNNKVANTINKSAGIILLAVAIYILWESSRKLFF